MLLLFKKAQAKKKPPTKFSGLGTPATMCIPANANALTTIVFHGPNKTARGTQGASR
jgi:hypothetical protein